MSTRVTSNEVSLLSLSSHRAVEVAEALHNSTPMPMNALQKCVAFHTYNHFMYCNHSRVGVGMDVSVCMWAHYKFWGNSCNISWTPGPWSWSCSMLRAVQPFKSLGWSTDPGSGNAATQAAMAHRNAAG
jgi:hypothetical protein